MVICLDKDTLSCRTWRRKIERALWVIWIELGFSGEFVHNLHSKTGTSGTVRDRFFEKYWKSKYRSKFLIWFLGITHQRVFLEKLWAIRKNWSCPEILDGYRKSLLRPLLLCQLDCGLLNPTQIRIFRAPWLPASSMCWPRSLGACSDERSLLSARGCFWIPPIARPRPWSGFGTRRSKIG